MPRDDRIDIVVVTLERVRQMCPSVPEAIVNQAEASVKRDYGGAEYYVRRRTSEEDARAEEARRAIKSGERESEVAQRFQMSRWSVRRRLR